MAATELCRSESGLASADDLHAAIPCMAVDDASCTWCDLPTNQTKKRMDPNVCMMSHEEVVGEDGPGESDLAFVYANTVARQAARCRLM